MPVNLPEVKFSLYKICLVVILMVLIQLNYGFLLTIWIFIGLVGYLLFTLDVKSHGSIPERETTSIMFDMLSEAVVDFLTIYLTNQRSIDYHTLFNELRKQETFPKFLLLRVLQDLELQGFIRSESNMKNKNIYYLGEE